MINRASLLSQMWFNHNYLNKKLDRVEKRVGGAKLMGSFWGISYNFISEFYIQSWNFVCLYLCI